MIPVIALILLWLILLCLINPNHFTSPDSWVYLRMAMFRYGWDSTFPVGYPGLIAVVSTLTGISGLWASKLVNGLAVMAFGWLWSKRVSRLTATLMTSVFLMGECLRIAAYTWSETVFLVLLAEWVWAYSRYRASADGHLGVRLICLGMALFLIRYVGLFVWLMLPVLNRIEKSRVRPLIDWLVAGTGLILCAGYFWLNNTLTGSPYGGERMLPVEPLPELVSLLGKSLLNELLLVRDWTPSQSLILPLSGALVQAGLCLAGWRVWQRIPADSPAEPSSVARYFLLTGIGYVICLWAIRLVSPFQGPDARTMVPMTFLLLMAFMNRLAQQPARQREIVPCWLLLVICSWAQVWPQRTPVQSQHSIISKSPSRAEIRTNPSCATSLLLPVR